MFRSINILDLPETAKFKLKTFGFEYCEDLERALQDKDTIPSHVKILMDNYKVAEALNALDKPKMLSIIDMWFDECFDPPVAIFHKGLYRLLNDGFPVGQMTEICGAPGSGKTQICLQAAIDVRMSSELGGSSGECLFISTDFGFKVERLCQIAEESARHMTKLSVDANSTQVNKFTVEAFLNSVTVIKICGTRNLFKVVMDLENHLKANRDIKLVIIDSFSLPLICEFKNTLQRTRTIHLMLDALQKLATQYKFAVILTNQLTTVVTRSKSKWIPSLGQSFGHRMHKRIILHEGKACIFKSLDQPKCYVDFKITPSGIR